MILAASSSVVYSSNGIGPGTAKQCSNSVVPVCNSGQTICWVYDPALPGPTAPWSNSPYAWPQCYDPHEYVCVNNVFLCPTNAPYACGRQCQNTTCTDPAFFQGDKNNGYMYPSLYYVNVTTTYPPTTTTYTQDNKTYTNTSTQAPTVSQVAQTWSFLPSDATHGCITVTAVETGQQTGSSTTGVVYINPVTNQTVTAAPTSTSTTATSTSTTGTGPSGKSQNSSATRNTLALIGTSIAAIVVYLL